MSFTKAMGDAHEAAVVQAIGGRQSAGSGNQWRNPADGRHSHHDEEFAFAWDCKSTFNLSHSVTEGMWQKIEEQAHHGRPAIPLRWYDPAFGRRSLVVKRDLIVVRLADFSELLDAVQERRCR